MQLQEFQGLALRTESQIQGIQLNRKNITLILEMVVALTEILDGIKKAAFYNKTKKVESDFSNHLSTIIRIAEALSWAVNGKGPVGAVMDAEETIPNIDPRVFHGILGIITESGELAAALLKGFADGEHQLDAVNVQEEMSDIAWYEAILHDAMGLDWGQGLKNVIEKLRIRYPEKYSDYDADNRDLDAERRALEVGVPQGKTGERSTLSLDEVAAAAEMQKLLEVPTEYPTFIPLAELDSIDAGPAFNFGAAIPLNWGDVSEEGLAALIDRENAGNTARVVAEETEETKEFDKKMQDYLSGNLDPK